ncbi:MAG: hypothetical protein KKF41_01570 [Actinobacteria bacterium]|nr:hypothetical protein [Actinomycetota bacterium]MBU2686254.1 hypothetical protein [Actinomycetota bacterium]
MYLDELPGLSDTDVSTTVTSDKPVVCERAVYFDYYGKSGGHDSSGYVKNRIAIPETTKVIDGDSAKHIEEISADLRTIVEGRTGESRQLSSS